MPDEPLRRSALHGLVNPGTYGRKVAGGPGIVLSERPFLSIVQALFVSVLSLVLAGIAAGVAKISKPRSVSAG